MRLSRFIRSTGHLGIPLFVLYRFPWLRSASSQIKYSTALKLLLRIMQICMYPGSRSRFHNDMLVGGVCTRSCLCGLYAGCKVGMLEGICDCGMIQDTSQCISNDKYWKVDQTFRDTVSFRLSVHLGSFWNRSKGHDVLWGSCEQMSMRWKATLWAIGTRITWPTHVFLKVLSFSYPQADKL